MTRYAACAGPPWSWTTSATVPGKGTGAEPGFAPWLPGTRVIMNGPVSVAPVRVFIAEVERPAMRRRDAGEIAAGRVDDAFGLAGRARGVEEVEHVLGVHRLGLDVAVGALDEVVPPHVTAVGPLDGL